MAHRRGSHVEIFRKPLSVEMIVLKEPAALQRMRDLTQASCARVHAHTHRHALAHMCTHAHTLATSLEN